MLKLILSTLFGVILLVGDLLLIINLIKEHRKS
jgi:hypothetical protein